MTMPHLMNCPHNDSGWCLACVKELWEEKQTLESALRNIQSVRRLHVPTMNCNWAEVAIKMDDVAENALHPIPGE